ncbi:macoilin-1 isoform X2 [Anthonomus grandis grandis]|uniref:macoilin-1 isoform X2 n=1 Tax=Anthonomus grandis grandis TaxID=2921223 RepID=UPI00216683D6|nr:macoilin-1 isoform X2 [Anthonomus grandis grandis]
MKRRNADLAKMRRPMKRNKITEGLYGSTLLYLKFLVLWILVILADYLLEFRFEFLWPFYLLLRSVYDSFKYQGFAFSVFFVLVSLTSDMLCYFFIPVHWLFFAASTYVWVQYVWHTDKGICAPTVVLWILFVYLEAAIRLRDVKHLPGHVDLCRPFAAHCIGYPIVTLGFGFKSYVGYRMRLRKQQHVAKENMFYMQLMQQALPVETAPPDPPAVTGGVDQGATQSAPNAQPQQQANAVAAPAPNVVQNSNHKIHNHSHKDKNGHIPNGTIPNGVHSNTRSHKKTSLADKADHHDNRHTEKHIERQNKINHSHTNGSLVDFHEETIEPEPRQTSKRKERREQEKDREAHEYLQKLETENRRLRNDLVQCRNSEQELRIQVAALTTSEKSSRSEMSHLQRQIDDLQERVQGAHAARQSDKQTIGQLERRMQDERRLRLSLESQLNQEKKNRKQDEARLAQLTAQQSSRTECTDLCKSHRQKLENELTECRQAHRWSEDRYKSLDLEKQDLLEKARKSEFLMEALTTVQEKNTHLQNALSAETRIKLDLFSALGDAKRHLEISQSANRAQEKEIDELKSKIAQVLAVMPNDTFGTGPGGSSSPVSGGGTHHHVSRVRLAESPPASLSKLDPNATAYTPKNPNGTLVASTEA